MWLREGVSPGFDAGDPLRPVAVSFGDVVRFGGDVRVDLGVAFPEGLLPASLLAMAFTAVLGWSLRAAGVDRVALVPLDGS